MVGNINVNSVSAVNNFKQDLPQSSLGALMERMEHAFFNGSPTGGPMPDANKAALIFLESVQSIMGPSVSVAFGKDLSKLKQDLAGNDSAKIQADFSALSKDGANVSLDARDAKNILAFVIPNLSGGSLVQNKDMYTALVQFSKTLNENIGDSHIANDLDTISGLLNQVTSPLPAGLQAEFDFNVQHLQDSL